MISVLTIAASDPSGGAGIQADLRVFASQGVAGLSALTAITVQNTHWVSAVIPVTPDVLAAQLDAILSDCKPGAVKIGLLPGADSVRVVADVLRRYRPPHVVLDPVLSSSGGVPFLADAGIEALLTELLPLCDLVTPNLHEAVRLVGPFGEERADRQAAATRFFSLGAKAVLLKGGHLNGPPEDLLVVPERRLLCFSGPHIDTLHTHGTGCFLSSAIAARLALGDSLPQACRTAKSLLTTGLKAPIVIGGGRGSPDPFAGRGRDLRSHLDRFRLFPGIYVLTDPDLQANRTAEEVARAAYEGGAAVVQLRDKRLTTPDLIETARSLQALAQEYGRLFIVNDRVDVAAAADADGVHLGPDDMHPQDALRILGREKLIGVSVGTVEEAVAMAPFASYLAVGAVYGSKTKLDAGPAVGPERIEQIRHAVPGVPLAAIGGINLDNITEVRRAGAVSAAVVSAVLQHEDIA
ncbi:MAG: bifunctional hydroxymethylpyrimidine kinase/phosphomethylpyrimidine kinase, partial [Armatimonadota bacterium]|nr:bifunctional hydroxymethylpyrimidine kinase/phosphomethylpyrimidine kinase [Armatimonadota bacterium]